jgi:Xaa-Pro aminopeptidase
MSHPQRDRFRPRSQWNWQKPPKAAHVLIALLLLICGAVRYRLWIPWPSVDPTPFASEISSIAMFEKCSIRNFRATNFSFLDGVQALRVEEFVDRRDRLAQALYNDGIDAFLIEPGYTFQYYANISQKEWEVWEPEERPFLMVVRPVRNVNGKDIKASVTFLVPSFEEARARLLDMPFNDEIRTVTYEEHWNPYKALLRSFSFDPLKQPPIIMADEEMRDFISRGLSTAGFNVVGLGGTIEQVRQRKTQAEIDILRAVNTGTVEAVRAMRLCMTAGLTEDDVTRVLDDTLRSAGLDPFFDIVLFDENASNPHGGTNGSKTLSNETMVLIDVGAHLHGYSSDICRSFFPPFSKEIREDEDYRDLPPNVRHRIDVWKIVFDAQTASLKALHENASAASVDLAARGVIENAGYGEAFTHRVGHGIGIKAHESPYLHKGNLDVLLKSGMTFTSEPGIYLVDEFGVRHEDVLLVNQEGLPDVLSGRRAISPWNP